MHGHHTASFLLALSVASSLASASMALAAEATGAGLTFYGCADARGAILLNTLDEKKLPTCRHEQILVSWRTDESAFRRM